MSGQNQLTPEDQHNINRTLRAIFGDLLRGPTLVYRGNEGKVNEPSVESEEPKDMEDSASIPEKVEPKPEPKEKAVDPKQKLEEDLKNKRMWYCYRECKKAGCMDLFLKLADSSVFYRGSHVDPRQWFGPLTESEPEIPYDLAVVLAHLIVRGHVEYLCNPRKSGDRFQVSIFGRLECQLPRNWTAPLIRMLLPFEIYIEDDSTCRGINHPHLFGYARDEQGNYKPDF